MKKYSIIIFAAIAILITSDSVMAQGQTNAAENRAADISGGYSFAVPSGWIKKEGNGGFALMNSAKTIIIAVKSHNYKDFDSFVANLNLAGEGMQQIGETRDLGGGGKFIRAAKETGEGILVVDTLVLFSPHGGGVAIASFTDQTNAKTGLQAAVTIAESLRFGKPQESSSSSEWQNYLRGKHLVYLNNSRNFSDRTDIYLCPTGRFYLKGNTTGVLSDGWNIQTFGNGNNNSGTWRVTSRSGDQLILQSESGATSIFTLEYRQTKGEISLNGSRYFVKSDANCQ